MDYIAQPKDYWIATNAINITRNALGSPNRIQCSVASGAAILCYIEGVAGLGYDNGHRFRTWLLTISPTYFNSNTEKYVYVAIPRTAEVGTQAVVVFPSEQLDIYGVNADDEQVGSTDYYYIWLQGILTATDGTSNREWQQTIDFGKKGTDEDLYDDTSSDWYQYSRVSGLVTFLKNIRMKAGTTFQNLILGNKELTSVATSNTAYTDSDALVATPGYVESQYLSKTHESTAQEQVGFLKGLWVKAKNLFGIDANGNAKLNNITASQLIANVLKTPGFAEAAGMIGNGFGVTMRQDGTAMLQTDDLLVLGRMLVNSLNIREVTYIGGVYLLTPAGSTVAAVLPIYGESADTADTRFWTTDSDNLSNPVEVGYRLLWLADDGTTATMNFWQQGDQAYSQTFNIKAGEHENVTNSLWWRLVVGVGTDDDPLGDGKEYHYADVADTDIVLLFDSEGEPVTGDGGSLSFIGKGSSYAYVSNGLTHYTVPTVGDKAVCLGSQTSSNRRGAIQLNTEGVASIGIYDGINNYAPLSTHEVHFFSKDAVRMSSRRFRWTTATGASTPPIIYRGDWAPVNGVNPTSYYYDEWDYQGSRWLCLYQGAEGITCAPGEMPSNAPQGATVADYWKQISLKGEKGDSVLTGYCDYFHGVDWNGGTRPEASETTVGAVDLLDYHGNNGDMIDVGEEISGSYSWEGHSVPLGSRYMMRGGDFAIYVATANGWIREGKNGTDGASVSYDAEHSSLQYAVSQYGTAGSGRSYPSDISSWQNAMPAVQKGKYLWTKDTTAYNNDGTIVYDVTYGVTYWPQDGESVEIDTDNTFVKYSTVKTAARPADNTFTLSSPPSLSQGDYLWSLTQVKYVGFDPLKSYSVSRVGTDGYDGDPGSDGYTTHFAYAKLKSGQSIPTSGKLTTAMVDQWARANFAGADAIGTYRDQTGTDSTNISSYTWTKWKGDKGDDGASVMAQYAPNSSPSSSQIHDTWQSGDIYMRTKSTSESSWSSWHKIVGESGGETDYTFNISSVLATNNPSDPTIEPSPCGLLEWADAPVATTSTYPYLWMRIVKKTWNASTQSYTSGTPKYIRITGKDGNTTQTVTVYKRSDTQPATPTGSTIPPMGWSTSVPVMCSGDFSDVTSGDYKGWRKATGDDNDGAFIKDTITFVTTSPNEVVRIAIKASSEEDYDFIFVGNLNANYASRPQDMDDISDSRKASGEESKIVSITVPTAGEHTLCVIYTKDGSSYDGMDCGWYKIINMENIVWSSMATFKNNILQGSWSTPVRWNGSDGDDGYSVTLTPSTIIINQSEELTTVGGVKDYYLDYTNATAILEVKKGGVPVDASITRSTDGTCSVPTITHQSTGRYLITMGAVNKHSGNTYVDPADDVTRTRYYDKGRITINVTPNGASETTRLYLDFRCNLQGTLKTTIKGDVETTVAEKITYGYNNETGSVGSLQAVGKYIRSSEKNIAQLTETIGARSNGNNLFGFSKGVEFNNAIPFVQGYGVVSNVGSSVRMALENFGFEGKSGYYVVTCEAKMLNGSRDITFSFWGKGSLYQTRTIGSDWTKLTMVFNLTGFYDGDNLSYRRISESGYFYTEGTTNNPLTDSNRLAIRYLQIERGSVPSDFGVCKEDEMAASVPVSIDWSVPSAFTKASSGGPDGGECYYNNTHPASGSSIEINAFNISLPYGVYTMSFWAKANVDEYTIQCICGDVNDYDTNVMPDLINGEYGVMESYQESGMNRYGSVNIKLSTQWRKYYVPYYLASAGNMYIVPMRINYGYTGGSSGTFYISKIKFDKGYVTSANRTEYQTVMRQTARNIDFSVLVNSMEKAGIHLYTTNNTTPDNEEELAKGVIDLVADKVNFKDSNGANANTYIQITSDGKLKAVDGEFSGKVTATSGSFTGSLTLPADNGVFSYRGANTTYGAFGLYMNSSLAITGQRTDYRNGGTTRGAVLRIEAARTSSSYRGIYCKGDAEVQGITQLLKASTSDSYNALIAEGITDKGELTVDGNFNANGQMILGVSILNTGSNVTLPKCAKGRVMICPGATTVGKATGVTLRDSTGSTVNSLSPNGRPRIFVAYDTDKWQEFYTG